MVGVGYRFELAPWIESGPAELDCVEITAENFSDSAARRRLGPLAARYPLMVHSLALSLGTPGPLEQDILGSLAEIARQASPLWISEHLGFCRTDEVELGHFNPVCPSRDTLGWLSDHVREVVEACGAPLILENITSELRVKGHLSETEFLNRLCEESGCGLLLDVTNLFVNSRNHGFDASGWLRDIDPERIVQLHVVGYQEREGRWYDTHTQGIQEDLWALIRETLEYATPRAVVIERDDNFPPVQELEGELRALRAGAEAHS